MDGNTYLRAIFITYIDGDDDTAAAVTAASATELKM